MPKRKHSGVTGAAQRRRRAEAARLRGNEHQTVAEAASVPDTAAAYPTVVRVPSVPETAAPHQAVVEVASVPNTAAAHQAVVEVASVPDTAAAQQAVFEVASIPDTAAVHQAVVEVVSVPKTAAERDRLRRLRETAEQTELRRRQQAERQRALRAEEDEEDLNRRRSQAAERQRALRAEEDEEDLNRRRSEAAERQRALRAEEDEEDLNRRRSQAAERQRALRAEEDEEDLNRRRSQVAEQHRRARAEETIPVREERLLAARNRRSRTTLHNIGRSANTVDVVQHTCGSMNGCCNLCTGLFFLGEKNTRGRYARCCHNGKIIESERNYPQELRDLMTGQHPLSAELFNKIRNYNSVLSFASMGAQIDTPPGSGPYCFRIHGAIYHRTSHLHPPRQGGENYAQLYILDSDQALRQRLNIMQSASLSATLLMSLDSIIRSVNPYAEAYKMLKEFEDETVREQGAETAADVRMFIKGDRVMPGAHIGRYNAPKENEVAAVFKSSDGVPPSNRDVAIHPRGGGLIKLSTLNPNLEPMTYVVFFPHGDAGFQVGQNFTELQFYSHRLSVRRDCFNSILYGRKLFQQYVVDAYVKIEGNRLSYLKSHQKELRVENYMGLTDHVQRVAEQAGARCGVPVILPSTFIGSPRSMQQNYQDAMAIVRDFGKPDLFLTFTCNPKWPEIQQNLLPGQKPHDRPDIVARVFDLKKTALLEDLKKNYVLGVIVADIHVIEFQKRGLPHMHLLLILAEDDRVRDAEAIDTLVCAELPDASCDPLLYDTVRSSMIHGPCGTLNPNAPCMVEGVCSKGYPKAFQETTLDNVGGYPLYRRRDNGHHATIRNQEMDNRWVVPYNPLLSKKFNAHINVEICSSIKSVKYLFKYVYKGHDAATVVMEQAGEERVVWDEIKSFLNARYVSAPEAVWRIFEKRMHEKSHSIIRLPVHLENMQQVYFVEEEEREALQRAAERCTMLTGWFALNSRCPEARDYLYPDIPSHFTWRNYAWQRRIRLGDKIISRMYSVSPKDVERFHLRLLLCHVKGATSFEDVRTYNDQVHATFKEACRARGLLQDDEEWRNCLTEAVAFQMPSQLRQLFSCICVFGNPTEPVALWDAFKDSLSEDFARTYSVDDSRSLALSSIQDHLRVHNLSLAALGLPQPSAIVVPAPTFPIYDADTERQRAEEMKEKLSAEQKVIFDAVLRALEDESLDCPRAFCVNAFAGAGKTYLFKTILHAVRGKGCVAVPVAWTGIAAALLDGGRTVHSTFKLPIPVVENSTCKISPHSCQAANLKTAKLIVWDECTMTPSHALEAVDRLLRDLTRQDVPFGGKTVLLGGDWRQILPVTPHGNRVSALETCLRSSVLWAHFKKFTLTRNMRLHPEEREFSDWLLRLGDGTLGNDSGLEEDLVEIPPACVVSASSLVDDVFGRESFLSTDPADRAILCPRNEEALKLNEEILGRIPGEVYILYSADSIVCDNEEEQDVYQMDFVNSLTPSGMPPHRLNLKVGALVMLLRNIDPSNGLCNGTRLIARRVTRNVLDCEVVSGQSKGSRVFIPRTDLSPSDSDLPFTLKRRQFPIRLSFAMTINKSQGQTMKMVGIYLPRPVFSHGMLYVAFSRCTAMNSIRVAVEETSKQGHLIKNSPKVFTKNIVYREVLQ